jgi:hypothetical protein
VPKDRLYVGAIPILSITPPASVYRAKTPADTLDDHLLLFLAGRRVAESPTMNLPHEPLEIHVVHNGRKYR